MKRLISIGIFLGSLSCFADEIQALSYLESRGWGGSFHQNTIKLHYHQPTINNQQQEAALRMYEAEMGKQRGMYAPRNVVNNYYDN